MKTNWSGKHVLILGAARQGVALARWLTQHAASVTLSDQRNLEELAGARASLADLNVKWAAGGHPLELLDGTDVLCLSGGVSTSLPIVKEASKRGIPLSNDTQIFMEEVPGLTIGITGSAGKTTTTTLVGMMAKISFRGGVYVGGNIGDPLINYLDEINPNDLAIMEISSFQLEQMTISPNIAAILNITPNHLDRHGTLEIYTAAKTRLLEFQEPNDIAILSRDNFRTWELRGKVKGRLLAFSLVELEPGLDGTFLHDGLLNLRTGHAFLPLLLREKIHLRGDHNVSNVLAAFAIGHAASFSLDGMLEAVESFRGIPHRLELVRELRGVRWYNDSIATTPERTIAAIRSFDEPIVLLLGGRDKDLPWEDLAALVHARVDHVVLFGEAADKISRALMNYAETAVPGGKAKAGKSDSTSTKSRTTSHQIPFSINRCDDLQQAVVRAVQVAGSGDIVLLSPGGTSFDAFKDFEERGERFREWVQAL